MSTLSNFEKLDVFYPGSRQRIDPDLVNKTDHEIPAEVHLKPHWDKPRWYAFEGTDYEFFSVGDLAAALNRAPVTIRYWEAEGYLPMTLRAPSSDAQKRQRLYSRPQIEGILTIAREEGILTQRRPRIPETRFTERVMDLFIELAKLSLYGAVPRDNTA